MTKAYRQTRLVVLMAMAWLPLPWLVYAVLPFHVSTARLVVAAVFAVLSVLTIRVVPGLIRRTLQPLSPDLTETEARRASVERFGPVMGGGTVAAMVVPVWAFIVGDPVSYAVPFIVAEVLLYKHVFPRPAVIEAARRRLEENGAKSYLWEALTGPSSTTS